MVIDKTDIKYSIGMSLRALRKLKEREGKADPKPMVLEEEESEEEEQTGGFAQFG